MLMRNWFYPFRKFLEENMKKIFLLLILIISSTMAQPPQTFFVIGCSWDPYLTGTVATDNQILQKVIDANINLLTGVNTDGRTGSFAGPSGPQFPWLGNTYRAVNNGYVLERIADVDSKNPAGKQLYTLIAEYNNILCDKRTLTCPTPTTAFMNNYRGLPTNQRSILYGYLICDEPIYGPTTTFSGTVLN